MKHDGSSIGCITQETYNKLVSEDRAYLPTKILDLHIQFKQLRLLNCPVSLILVYLITTTSLMQPFTLIRFTCMILITNTLYISMFCSPSNIYFENLGWKLPRVVATSLTGYKEEHWVAWDQADVEKVFLIIVLYCVLRNHSCSHNCAECMQFCLNTGT